jgi:cytosine deaminase
MFDLIVRRANLTDGRTHIGIGVREGRVAALQAELQASVAIEIDAL